MSHRLQVLVDEGEIREIRAAAERNRLTVAEWVRQALRKQREAEPANTPQAKIAAIEKAYSYSFPTADIEQMNEEISRGYGK